MNAVLNMSKRLLKTAKIPVLIAFIMAAGAFAGEVKGPPGQTDNTNVTAAPEHAKSECAFSGLNDFDQSAGQTSSIVQTVADAFKYYFVPVNEMGKLCIPGVGD